MTHVGPAMNISLVFALTTKDKIDTKHPDATSIHAICNAGFCMIRITTTGTRSREIIVQIESSRVVMRRPRLLNTKIFESFDTVGGGA
jgi:hypothetical protein